MEIEYRHLDSRVVKLETEIPHLATKADIAQMETRMTRWIVGVIVSIAVAAISILVSILT